jgi:hypothetical protein
MMGRRSILGVSTIALGIGTTMVATQTADEVQSPVPHKVELAHWLETGLWVNPYLLVLGTTLLFVGVVLTFKRRATRYPLIALSGVVLVTSLWILIVSHAGNGMNLTRWAPQ